MDPVSLLPSLIGSENKNPHLAELISVANTQQVDAIRAVIREAYDQGRKDSDRYAASFVGLVLNVMLGAETPDEEDTERVSLRRQGIRQVVRLFRPEIR